VRRREDDIRKDQEAGTCVDVVIPEIGLEVADGGVRRLARVRDARAPVHRPDYGIIGAIGEPIERKQRQFFERAHAATPPVVASLPATFTTVA
jgi:hypothetical protein